MTHKPEVGKWYEHRYGGTDRYVVGFDVRGDVVVQDKSGNLFNCTLKYFHDNYKKKPEIVRKYFNVYLYKDGLMAPGALYNTEEKAKAESHSTDYVGTYQVDIRLS